jgi:hypothetical protein
MRSFKLPAILTSLLLLVLTAGVTKAQSTYFVDAIEGNDAFNGSRFGVGTFPAGAFFSIRYAVNKAESGDTIAIRAGDYTDQGVINPGDKDLTFMVMPRGSDQAVILDGIATDHSDRMLTLANGKQAPEGRFTTNGNEDDLTVEAGTIHVTGSLTIGKGGSVNQTSGTLSGNELIKE